MHTPTYICTPNSQSKGCRREVVFIMMTGGLCVTVGSMLTYKTALCPATVKFALDLLEGGHQ